MWSAGEAGRPFDGMPISPELILVSSPEEQQWARELLPPSPADDWDLLLAGIRARASLQPVEPVEVARAHKPRRMLVLASLVLVAVAVPIGMAGARDDVTLHRMANVRGHVQRSTSRAVPPVTLPAAPVSPTTRPHAKPKATQGTKRQAAPPTTGKKSAAPKAKTKTAKRPAAPRVSGFVPSRVWGWVAQPGSVTYLFRLYRNGRQVYVDRTKQAQLMLPKSFHFVAGTYRWSVVALGSSKTHSAKPLVESTFVLSPAAAAKANR
jgi:hypothetical protein